ncbi:MAG TPA: hypothetical protein DGG95_13630 [Cytophagales bacterium]|jgi:hypothetical protein|nr:hypothetical protein [Cytophagales bacterium]
MASTVEKTIVIRNNTKKLAFPVKSGATIYHGCVGVVKIDGYLYNHASTIVDQNGINYIGIIADETANSNGTPAATTADGSILTSQETRSVPSGDATVRTLYLNGQFYAAMTGLTQANVGDVVYATDNFTFAVTGTIPIGTISKVLSATLAEIDLNCFMPMQNIVKSGELFSITKNITTGSATEDIYSSNAPFAFEIVDVIVQPRGASTNGTMKVTDGTSDITNAMTCAVDKTIARAGTIDDAKSTIAVSGSLRVVCAGDTIGNTIGLVTVVAIRS